MEICLQNTYSPLPLNWFNYKLHSYSSKCKSNRSKKLKKLKNKSTGNVVPEKNFMISGKETICGVEKTPLLWYIVLRQLQMTI